MNNLKKELIKSHVVCFRPQQGLLIMNLVAFSGGKDSGVGFRPQQGLLIMNCLSRRSIQRSISR